MEIGKISSIGTINPETGLTPKTNSVSAPGKSFADFVGKSVETVNADMVKSEKMSTEFLTEGKHDLHEVMISLEKAEVSFKFLTQIRNKVLEAYSEVMRTQV